MKAEITIDLIETLRKMQVQIWPVDRLLPYVRNARTHSDAQVAKVAASIKHFGWTNPILVGPDNVIIAGHARLLAARKLGLTEVPVIVLGHLNETDRRGYVLADNQIALDAGWDEDLLHVEIVALRDDHFDLELTGFSKEELDAALLDPEQTREGLTDGDAAPEPQETAITVLGDLWVLGEHRLLCGDATSMGDVEKVLAGGRADMCFTDSPYNIDYEGRTKDKLKIQNDKLGDKFYEFLRESIANILAVTDGAVYMCMSSSELHTLYRAFTDAGGHWSTFIIWVKNHFTLGWGDYRRQFEPILYGWRDGVSHFWCGDRNQGDAWMINRAAANRDHPTPKPVELVERAIRNSCKPRGAVIDPFAGSGTTAIACEKTGRIARLVELDPKYCDVIIRRWQNFAGKQALHEESGRAFSDLAANVAREAA